MRNLTEKTVFVSGSTKGIGNAIAARFVHEGARVFVHSRSQSGAVEAQNQIGAAGAVWGDLSDADGTNQVLDQLSDYAPVDVLINNAGVFSVEDFFQLTDDVWLDYFQTNVMSMVRLCRALMPAMLQRDSGVIINVASEAAIKPLPQMVHYSMTKAAMLSISRGIAELTKGSNVCVNTLMPGPTWTDGVEKYFEGLAKQEGRPLEEVLGSYFREHEPTSLIQRFVKVDEVADAAVFLAQNTAVNGSSLRVEGGIIRSI